MKTIGLLAGIGRLPVEFAHAARGMGFTVIAIGLLPNVDRELATAADHFHSISIGELDKIFMTLKEYHVEKVTLLGKVTKELMFTGQVAMDLRMKKLLFSLPDNSDDTIMLAFVKELAAENISVLDQTQLLKTLMLPPGVLTKRQPTNAQLEDIKFGFDMAKKIGGLDIGQTVVVKNLAVMAVEAIEGTDACIRRGGKLCGKGAVVAKVAKPKQDMRFDVPSVGPDTLRAMIDARASALVMEAGKTLLVAREETLALADEHHITVVVME